MLLTELTLEDLAQHSGLPIRTLRYYIQEGLLPGPDTRGKYASYSQEHLDSLTLIMRLKDLHLPLKEIRHLLDNASPEDISQLISYQDALNAPSLPYKTAPSDKPAQAKTAPSARETETPNSALDYIHSLTQAHETVQSLREPPQIFASKPNIIKLKPPYQTKPESWQRIQLADGIELHLRSPHGVQSQAKIDKLIKYAQSLFKESTKKGK